eukprot:scaffold74479_cov31-Prasinocladus_malaysianus.AAC.2
MQFQAQNTTDCFYFLSGMTCEETSRYLDHYKEDPQTAWRPSETNTNGPLAWQLIKTSPHSRGSDMLLKKFYTPELLDLAYPFVEADLKAFQYTIPNLS